MLNQVRQIIFNHIEKYVDLHDWRNVRKAYFWYTYLAFLQLSFRKISYCVQNCENILDDAVEKNIIDYEISIRLRNLPGYVEFIDCLKLLPEENIDIAILYQQFISRDFCISGERVDCSGGKNGRDMLGAYYTGDKFSYEITEKAIDDYILLNLNISNFTKSHESIEQVMSMFQKMKFMDSSCGAGEFLLAVIEYCKSHFVMNEKFISQLESNLYGYDTDPLAILITKIRIMLALKSRKSRSEIRLGNPLNLITEYFPQTEKFEMASEGRYYNKCLGISQEEEKYDIILGNPPWEKIRFEERKFLSHYIEDTSSIENKANREKYINENISSLNYKFYSDLRNDYEIFKDKIKKEGLYKDSACGEINTYAIFTDWSLQHVKDMGLIGLIVKSSLLKTSVYSRFFDNLLEGHTLYEAYMFTNKKKIFQIDSREEFSVLFLSLEGKKELNIAVNIEEYKKFIQTKKISITPEILRKINPITGMIPNIKSYEELNFLIKLCSENSMFENVYKGCRFGRLVHLTNHSNYIIKNEKKGYLPIYEGKFIEQYTAKYATFSGMNESEKYANKSQAALIGNIGGENYPEARYFIEEDFWTQLSKSFKEEFSVVWRSLTSATNRRTMLATLLPKVPSCQSIQLLQIQDRNQLLQILALFNSVIFDYIVRLKMAGLDLTQTIIKQIPVPDLESYESVIAFEGVTESIGTHIFSRVKYLCKDDNRILGIFKNIYTYEVQGSNSRKQIIAEIDRLIAAAYRIDQKELKFIVELFDKYYTKEEAEIWF